MNAEPRFPLACALALVACLALTGGTVRAAEAVAPAGGSPAVGPAVGPVTAETWANPSWLPSTSTPADRMIGLRITM